jgi:hypothetical protein
MKKIIREVDIKRGIHQVTIADERWYLRPTKNELTGLPDYMAVPSVTWITQSYPKGIGYFKWLAERGWDEAEAIKTQAGDKGTKVHLAIEDILAGKEVRIDSKYPSKTTGNDEELTLEECDAILSFTSWKKSMEENYIIETLATEITVFSMQYNYAGTVDWIVKMTHKETQVAEYWIIDFKTSQQVWPSHELQLNAYKRVLENGENKVQGLDVTDLKLAVLQVGYRKNKNQYKFNPIDVDFEMFLVTQKIWQKEHGGEKISKRDYPIILSPAVKTELDKTVEAVVEVIHEVEEIPLPTPDDGIELSGEPQVDEFAEFAEFIKPEESQVEPLSKKTKKTK